MGIKNCQNIFRNTGRYVDIETLRNKRVSIDMMTYSVQIYKTSKSVNTWKNKVIHLLNNFTKFGVVLICVFDGYNKPKEKLITMMRRKEQTEKYRKNLREMLDDPHKTEGMLLQISRLERLVKYPSREENNELMILITKCTPFKVLIAEGDAEALCCKLYKDKEVDYVLTEDSDVILYNIDNILMKFNFDHLNFKLIHVSDLLREHQLTFDQLFYLCALLGTDYNSSSMKWETALKAAKLPEILDILQEKDVDIKRLKSIFNCDNISHVLLC
jgi:5'-3' exonuclease